MIILARPSISPYLSKTLFELGEPAILAEDIKVPMRPALRIEPARSLHERPKHAYQSLILTASENALAFLQDASAEMQPLARAGKCWEPAEKEFQLPKYEKMPGYAAALPFVARRYCGLWGRGT